MKSIAVIGDVHGCAKTLLALIKKIPTEVDLYSVGDMIDRGPSNVETVQIFQSHKIRAVMGNHEWLFLQGAYPNDTLHKVWLKNGGVTTNGEFKTDNEKNILISYFKTLPYYIKIDNYLISHAGVANSMNLEMSLLAIGSLDYGEIETSILWNRMPVQFEPYFQIYGHTKNAEVVKTPYGINIDTGCVYGNKLTALLLPSMTLVEQPYLD